MLTFEKSAQSSGEKWRWRLFLAWTQIPPHFTSPRSPLLISQTPTLSPELQYEINIGPAGNERSPQEIEEGGKEEEETKEKQRKEP